MKYHFDELDNKVVLKDFLMKYRAFTKFVERLNEIFAWFLLLIISTGTMVTVCEAYYLLAPLALSVKVNFLAEKSISTQQFAVQ